MMNVYQNSLVFFSVVLLFSFPLPFFSYFIPQKYYSLEKHIDHPIKYIDYIKHIDYIKYIKHILNLPVEILLCQTHADCPPYFFCDTTFSPFLNYCRKHWPSQPLPIPVPVPVPVPIHRS